MYTVDAFERLKCTNSNGDLMVVLVSAMTWLELGNTKSFWQNQKCYVSFRRQNGIMKPFRYRSGWIGEPPDEAGASLHARPVSRAAMAPRHEGQDRGSPRVTNYLLLLYPTFERTLLNHCPFPQPPRGPSLTTNHSQLLSIVRHSYFL